MGGNITDFIRNRVGPESSWVGPSPTDPCCPHRVVPIEVGHAEVDSKGLASGGIGAGVVDFLNYLPGLTLVDLSCHPLVWSGVQLRKLAWEKPHDSQ